jgi:hypothetical protein
MSELNQEQIGQAYANLAGFRVNPDLLAPEQISAVALHYKPQQSQFDQNQAANAAVVDQR